MRNDLRGAVRALAIPTVGLLAVAALAPGRLELAVRIYALVLAGAVIVLALQALERAYPPTSELRVDGSKTTRTQSPASLGRIEHEVALGVGGAFDVHFRLVPRLRTLAAGLLASRRTLSLTANPDEARAILGEDAWELVRPERPAPEDRLAAGMTPRELERVVEALERV